MELKQNTKPNSKKMVYHEKNGMNASHFSIIKSFGRIIQ